MDPSAPTRFWETFEVGLVEGLGTHVVAEREILAFASAWDPQPFHVDVAEAGRGPFGGLIASGWHTVSICMRLFVDAILVHTVSLGSPGVDEIRWPSPVRPDDRLAFIYRVREARPSSSRPQMGIVVGEFKGTAQDGRTVLTMRATSLLGRRPA